MQQKGFFEEGLLPEPAKARISEIEREHAARTDLNPTTANKAKRKALPPTRIETRGEKRAREASFVGESEDDESDR